jgi:hypothetical protein
MPATELQVTSLVNMMIQLYKRREDPGLKKQFDLQRARYEAMANGGDGGKAGLYGRRPSSSKKSTHESSIRELHHATWDDEDFVKLLKALEDDMDKHDKLSDTDDSTDDADDYSKENVVKRAADAVCVLLDPLCHNDRAEVLNDVAERLGMYEPD